MENIKYYLCNKPADLFQIKYYTSGIYETTCNASEDIESLIADKLYILSVISRNSYLKNYKIRITPEICNELIENTISPRTPLEMIDRLLISMVNSSRTFDEPITLKPGDNPLVFAKNANEFVYLLSKAIELEYHKKLGQNKYIIEMKG
ncbi:hypothetical protein ACX8XN_02185 [Calditrichota bacterium GD2]